jgi:ribosome-binding factor A
VTDTARARKLADRVHEIVAEALEKRIKDPRLGFITITDTRMTGDLQHASIFYTVFGDPQEQADTAAALESAKGVLRSEVGKRIGIRLTPSLEFIPDALPQGAAHLDELLAAARARDAAVAAVAANASYAGDPDPYRKPADLDDDDTDDDDTDDDGDDEDGAGDTGDEDLDEDTDEEGDAGVSSAEGNEDGRAT